MEYTVLLKFVGGRIKALRKKKKLTQVQLAEKAGLQDSNLSRLESGSSNVTLLTLSRIAETLGVEVKDFFKN